MKSKLAALLAVGMLVAVSAKVFADDNNGHGSAPVSFRVVHLDDVGPRSEKARTKSLATKSRIAAIQNEIASDPVLSRKLRARGVPLRHIIGRQRAINGSVVLYLR